jgi:aminodeoxyfutalosine synthase
LHPQLPFEYYTDICQSIRSACPRIHIKAFTAIEIIHFARIARPKLSIKQVLERLAAAGLDSLPGGGAEIFDQRVHDEAFGKKVGAAGWFDVHSTAHELGICSNATMLFGHIEGVEERIRHLLALRDEQDRSVAGRPGRFNCMVALPFLPAGSELSHLPGPSGLEQLKTLAICRLMLDNFAHVKAFWVMFSPKLAQVSLSWGVDDLDGTVSQYQIVGADQSPEQASLTVDQLRLMIAQAGFEPVERDSLYRRVTA